MLVQDLSRGRCSIAKPKPQPLCSGITTKTGRTVGDSQSWTVSTTCFADECTEVQRGKTCRSKPSPQAAALSWHWEHSWRLSKVFLGSQSSLSAWCRTYLIMCLHPLWFLSWELESHNFSGVTTNKQKMKEKKFWLYLTADFVLHNIDLPGDLLWKNSPQKRGSRAQPSEQKGTENLMMDTCLLTRSQRPREGRLLGQREAESRLQGIARE